MSSAGAPGTPPVASIRDLKVVSDPGGKLLLDGVTLALDEGETVGLVGESGAGKSLTAMALLGLLRGARVISGQVSFRGRPLAAMSPPELQRLRGRRIGLVFQEPSMALDPLVSIGAQLAELFRIHERDSAEAARRRAREVLETVGIEEPARIAASFPHQLSGGQRQRCVIGLAAALGPDLLVADEPTAALDVALQVEILGLLARLGRERGRSLLLVSHDLSHVAALADRIVVLRRGRVVEEATCEELVRAPRHTYTRQLLAAAGVAPC